MLTRPLKIVSTLAIAGALAAAGRIVWRKHHA
jgi:hypothetical protein